MRSEFKWWCKRQIRSFKHEFKTDWQFRLSVVVTPMVVGAMVYLASNSQLVQRFLLP